ncbi:MAG: DUF1932 domain-containing protein [Myxococcales bacterium]|nr:DUF1932 domain-containing protein [Myxococcales bacterium]
MKLGILHPGAMGSTVGAAASATGHDVYWCTQGRSRETHVRAEASGLRPVACLQDLADGCDGLISVCPPAAALEQANAVAALGFSGLYVDANAVSPQTAGAVSAVLTAAGADVVDGGIVGPPVREGGSTILYLSGPRAGEVAACFEGSHLEAHVLGPTPGHASALKMAFAAWTKGSSALLLAVRALAQAEGVSDGLLHAWSRFGPELCSRSEATARSTAPKAWRFGGEMREIAATFEAAGLPSDFHRGAAEIYDRMAGFQHGDVDLNKVLDALLNAKR